MKEKIIYRIGQIPNTEQICEVYDSSGINRPTQDQERIAKMYENSNLVITAWQADQLIGISRALTDFSYCCYLSDLAVRKSHQNAGIGKKLIAITKEEIGPKVTLLLMAAPSAMDYYPKVGFQLIDNGYIIKKTA